MANYHSTSVKQFHVRSTLLKLWGPKWYCYLLHSEIPQSWHCIVWKISTFWCFCTIHIYRKINNVISKWFHVKYEWQKNSSISTSYNVSFFEMKLFIFKGFFRLFQSLSETYSKCSIQLWTWNSSLILLTSYKKFLPPCLWRR